MRPYCNESRHISLRIHFVHHHHMLPSCNPVVGLTFFTSAAACVARGLSADVSLSETSPSAINHEKQQKETRLTANEGLTDSFQDVAEVRYFTVMCLK